MANTTIKTLNGIEITVDEYGIFQAQVNGVEFSSGILAALEKSIEDELKTDAKSRKMELPCYVMLYVGGGIIYLIVELTLIGLNRTDSSFKWKETFNGREECILPKTDKNLDLMIALMETLRDNASIEKAISKRRLWNSHEGRIRVGDYEQALAVLQTRYNTAMKASTEEGGK